MINLLSWYSYKLPIYLVYMLQQVDYRVPKFTEWLRRNPNLSKVMHRRQLDKTQRAKSLLLFTAFSWVVLLSIGIALFILSESVFLQIIAICLLLVSPFLTAASLCAAVYGAYIFVAQPSETKIIAKSKHIFEMHPAIKIGIAGSYGKTSFKEIITTLLKEKFNVAATPGNMNTSIAHARFASKLDGDEDILVVEFGEEHPGDTAKFIESIGPDYAVLTGIAPNHLDYYKTVSALVSDLFELRIVGEKKLYINAESRLVQDNIRKSDYIFTNKKAGDWSISDVNVDLNGTSFTLTREKEKLLLKSGLLGKHQVTPLALAAVLAYELGLSKQQIEDGMAKTLPFEHRMQPRILAGATILDDTYNGNIEGILAGLDLLDELEAKRKIYITPGLVEQGEETKTVHHAIAKKLYDVAPDLIVLMDNSATKIIEDALAKLNYKGLIQIESNPLHFYQNIDKIIAAGDVVMMQNDWTDNYN